MSESISASIIIGGEIPTNVALNLIDAINAEEVHENWDSTTALKVKDIDQLLGLRDEDGHLFFCCYEAQWGEFRKLEDFCVLNGISYDRRADGKDEYPPEEVSWRPDGKGYIRRYCDENGNEMVRGDVVRDVMKLLERNSPVSDTVSLCRDILKKLCPEIPALPPFKVVNDAEQGSHVHVPTCIGAGISPDYTFERNGMMVVDINCDKCGTSGSARILPKDIMW